ncbi:MAG: sugar ABC transporter permease [Clostridiales bacterium]|jgi:arabinogalactan oligomer/maltooligosaccharide transport system permease protein|nr:sugar ABC transporter permease [Clostridiales bacterium]
MAKNDNGNVGGQAVGAAAGQAPRGAPERPPAHGLSGVAEAARFGDIATRLSFVLMGFGCVARRQFIKGLLFFAVEIGYLFYLIGFGLQYLSRINTLGTKLFNEVWDEKDQIFINTPGDNSMQILLFGVLTIFVTVAFALVYFASLRAAYRAQLTAASGKRPATFLEDLTSLLDRNLHSTLLGLPAVGVIAFTVLPLVFMVLLAFTNFDRAHQPPGNLFTWVGLGNFQDIFWGNPQKSTTFFHILGWTLIWAVFATFLNYVFGMVIALMINKKGIRLKGLWRFCFVLSIAVPAFVTLLLMRQMLGAQGAINILLQNVLHITDAPVNFLTDPFLAKVTVIIVNLWIGIPYTILITSGILMNIPADLYEAARIDGAKPVRQFRSITLPYMLFVTTPYLITQFIGNINNFNAIFFLTEGGPNSLDYYQGGKTDLLVTWLYRLTVNFQDYNLASTIGILVFIVCGGVSLLTFNLTASSKKEETFS